MKKITIDVSQMAYQGTGVARYTYELVKAILLASNNYEFNLWAGVRKQKSYFMTLAKTHPWDKATWTYSQLSPKLAAMLFNYSPLQLEYLSGATDLIHLSDWTAPVTHVPTVTTIHDLAFVKHPATVDPLIRSTQKIRLSRVIKHNNYLIADSMSTKNDLVEIYHLNPESITVIYPGISEVYHPQTKSKLDQVKKKYNLPDRFILSLGTQEPRKNLVRLIQATSSLGIPLVIAGKYGWGKKIDLPTHVQTIGFVRDEDLPALYQSSLVFAYPSLYEGFGFPVLEAMSSAAAVVTSHISSLPEIVAGAAILVDPTSTESITAGINQAIKNREKLIKLGLIQAKKFTWEKTAKQTLKLYEKILHAKN